MFTISTEIEIHTPRIENARSFKLITACTIRLSVHDPELKKNIF